MQRKSLTILFLFILMSSFFIYGISAHGSEEVVDNELISVRNAEYSIHEIYENGQLISKEINPKKETTNFFKRITANAVFKRGATTTASKKETTGSTKFSRGNLKPSENENLKSGQTYSVRDSVCKTDENGKEICAQISEEKFTTPTLTENVKKIEKLNQNIKNLLEAKSIEPINRREERDLTSLLTERKIEMTKLAKENPNEFLRLAMSKDLRNKIPQRNFDLVEKPVELSGSINFMHSEEIKPDGEIFSIKKSFFLSDSNEQFEIYLLEKQLPIIGELNAQIQGYQIDNILVASSFKKLSNNELSKRSNNFLTANSVRDLSGREYSKRVNTPLPPIPDPDDFIAFEKPEKTLKLAIIPVEFLDSGARPFTKEQAYESIFLNGHFPLAFKEQSYGRFAFTGKVFDWTELPLNGGDPLGDYYQDSFRCSMFSLSNYVLQNLPQATKDELREYDRIYFLANCPNYPWIGGYATRFFWLEDSGTPDEYFFEIRGGMTMFNSNNDALPWTNNKWKDISKHMEHELIHAMPDEKFIYHADGFDCDNQTLSVDCKHIEYGNKFDIMGDLGSYTEHTNAVFKEEMGWIKPNEILTINESGTYTISPLEGIISVNGKKPAKSIKAAKIKVGENFYPIYLEYRKAKGIDSALNNFELASNQNGLFILLSWFFDGDVSSSLLDADSYGLDWAEDLKTATLNSETIFTYTQNIFSDERLGITIGPILSVDPQKITFNVSLTPLPSSCGQTWIRTNTPYLSKIFFVDSNNGWAIGDNEIYRTTDGGQTWIAQTSNENSYYSDVQFIDQNNGWAVGYNNIYRTTDGGQTWTIIINIPFILYKISFADSNNGWAIGGNNILYRTTDGGQTWIQQQPMGYLYDIQFIDQNNGWAIGDNILYRTTDGGQTWTIINTPSSFGKISFVDSNNGWAIGNNEIYRTTDGGQTWVVQQQYTMYLEDIQFIDQNNGLAIIHNKNIYRTTDGGQTWIEEYGIMNFDKNLKDIFVLDNNHVWINADRKLYCLDTSSSHPTLPLAEF